MGSQGLISLEGHGLQHHLLIMQLPLRLLELGSNLGNVGLAHLGRAGGQAQTSGVAQ